MEFDYVIVGSGAGGSVLAERLSALSDATILVVEAGGSDRHPIHRVPKGFFFTMHSPRYAKKFVAGPFGPGGHVDNWWRGRVVGGSTTINGLVWNRGWAPDYDSLVAEGNAGWGWDTFLPAFRAIEDFRPGASAIHGGSGPVSVEIGGPPEAVSEAFMESASAVGVKRVLDLNGSDEDRTGYTQFSTRRGVRRTAADCFLRPALKRRDVRLLTRAEVGRVLFDGRRAVGVQVRHRDKLVEIRARREVLVCGGALDSPLLLERSGIGRGDVLAAAGVRQVAESPNVGERLNEHRGLRFMFTISGAPGYNPVVNTGVKRLVAGARYLVRRDGVIAQGSASVLAYFRADDSSERPDTIGFFNPISMKAPTMHNDKLAVDDEPGLMLAAYPLRPTSRGRIHITGADPDAPAAIDPGFLRTEHDRALIGKVGRKVREIFATGPIADLVRTERLPGPGVDTEEDFLRLADTAGASGYHPLGTCAMGPGAEDVVDDRLRVRGVEGLRVVDASVFPRQPSGNTSAPTQALAWHAASLVVGDR
ncbi:GMC family oxidoreductase N-terminal domain-containing protein [Phytohabitans sp. ZYX-F-186]|uniref:GMC family oxidoreductase N-terminal domain-containing protein n=1 Tax=Phytohabitans maris TaxID=3071409 RepID=A0ABU0ZQR0_9ACTN|nr:GMC family oxidoreductase N-terminal domain-containing protein [Phytohabitans sp. ZYX-F-186]MDQ7909340.1 GMC family oxidoreductase N-terminal domain-containing protein [Phytohabitans sp. ZYX-F-186]